MLEKSKLPKFFASLIDPIIDEINRTRLLRGDGIIIDETPSGEILSVPRLKQRKPKPAITPPTTSTWYFDMGLYALFEGSTSIETGGAQPTPNFGNPQSYYPFAIPSGSYPIQFLDNFFQLIPVPSQGAITAGGMAISNLTVTSVPDPFAFPPGQRIYEFHWAAKINYGGLTAIPNNVQVGRFTFPFTKLMPDGSLVQDIPPNATYALVGNFGPNAFGTRADNLGQFPLKVLDPNLSGGV